MTTPNLRTILAFALLTVLLGGGPAVAAGGTSENWPQQVKAVRYLSAADNSQQPAMFYAPKAAKGPRPLLVALHTWSHGYQQKWSVPYAKWCVRKGWVFVHPHFRGPNNRPEATGSELAVKDVLSAVDYAKSQASVDPSRIYLAGYSSGGMVALLAASRSPKLWAGVSVWGAVYDLHRWYQETKKRGLAKYVRDIEKSVGGNPVVKPAAAEQCRKRSPRTYLAKAKGLAIDVNAGIFDGHGKDNIVPVSHGLDIFNALALPKDRLASKDTAVFTNKARVPKRLRKEASKDPDYGRLKVLFRRKSGPARITVFQGGHLIHYDAAVKWLAKQRKR